jgi:hypothetical protein
LGLLNAKDPTNPTVKLAMKDAEKFMVLAPKYKLEFGGVAEDFWGESKSRHCNLLTNNPNFLCQG